MADQFITVTQAAELLQVSRATIYSLCVEKKLTHFRIGVNRGTIRIRSQDFDDFLRKSTITSTLSEDYQKPITKNKPRKKK